MPVDPPATEFSFAAAPDERGVVIIGGDLQPATLLAAYRAGAFPMRTKSGDLAWWSPDPRAVLRPADLRVARSLRRSQRRYETTVDNCFERVIAACAERDDDAYHWITADVRDAYTRLHELGWAHSVETWSIPSDDEPRRLVGGLYGVAIGGFFSGESMFSRQPDAAKVALVTLAHVLRSAGAEAGDVPARLIDVQWMTPHLASLGAVEVARDEYLMLLEGAVTSSAPGFEGARPGKALPPCRS